MVAFRGTEQVKWKDFLTDMRVNPTTFNTERVQGSRVPQLDAIGVVSASFTHVYRFCAALQQTRSLSMAELGSRSASMCMTLTTLRMCNCRNQQKCKSGAMLFRCVT